MFFVLRMAFWLGLVLILLPSGTAQQQQQASTNDIGASEAISAASATVQDMRGFCTRQPQACSIGSQLASDIGHRATAGAKMLYGFLTKELAKHGNGSPPDGASGSDAAKADFGKSWSLRGSQDTLTPADLVPAWRGPPSPKDDKPAA